MAEDINPLNTGYDYKIEWRLNMFMLRVFILVIGILLCQSSIAATKNSREPSGGAMAADLLVARPVLLVTTVVGSAIWLAALPFTALGRNVEESADALVVGPATATFVRCLGCLSGRKQEFREIN
jgi:hypothetical protein